MLALRSAQERAAFLQGAGFIASAIINVNRKKGAQLITPKDFIREERKPSDYMTTEQAIKHMNRWAAAINKGRSKDEVN